MLSLIHRTTVRAAVASTILLQTLAPFAAARADVTEAFRSMEAPTTYATTELIVDNNAAWYARWKAVSEARETIDLSYYSVHADIFGHALLGLLLKKAEEGLKIQMLIDAKASRYFAVRGKDFIEELATYPNVTIKIYNPNHKELLRAPLDIRYLMATLHTKLLITDGTLAITGGRNISQNYFTDPSDEPTAWRDTDVLLRGPEVRRLFKEAFDAEFNQARNSLVDPDTFGNWTSKRDLLIWAADAMERWMAGQGEVPKSRIIKDWEEQKRLKELMGEGGGSDTELEPDSPEMYNRLLRKQKSLIGLSKWVPASLEREHEIKILYKGSFVSTTPNLLTDNLLRLVDGAEEEIIIQNPYVVLTDRMLKALKRAHDRGVRLVFHTNSPLSTDSLFTQAFFIKDWDTIKTQIPNAKVHAFVGRRKLHSKVFVFDRKIAVIGTYNMDSMSEQINAEIMTAVHSEDLSAQLLAAIEHDLEVSRDFTPEHSATGDKTAPAQTPADVAPLGTRILLKILGALGFLRPLI